ncbi:MAG TPA: low affinity iron permease family protein [Sphingomicrobium sp.]|nr:low affinity iron permease family protein [Sphingomicrobium sp.]
MNQFFTDIASRISALAGRAATFLIATLIIVVWAATGPLFGFADTWQLVVNTGTTIITFLMVFLIQNTQNRDSVAIQAKLDELLRALTGAREGDFIGVEHLTDDEIEAIRAKLERVAAKKPVKQVKAAASSKGKSKRPASRRAPSKS